jgi:pimeloyl-ACP methyl ester carboxylesterase
VPSPCFGRTERGCEGAGRGTAQARLQPCLPLDEVLRRIDCPVLLMHARDDRVADVATRRMVTSARPDWELVEFEAGGHAIHVGNAVNLELARFHERRGYVPDLYEDLAPATSRSCVAA